MRQEKLIFKIRSGQIPDIVLREVEQKKIQRKDTQPREFQQLISLHRYKDALNFGMKYIETSPEILRELSACAYFAGEHNLSTEYMREYLASNKAPVEQFFELIKGLLNCEVNLQFSFEGKGGFANCGFISAYGDVGKYIGKIVEISRDSERELYFYENIAGKLFMDDSLPTYYGYVKLNNYICIVTNYYSGEKTTEKFDVRFYNSILKLLKYQKDDICFPSNKRLIYKGNCEAGLLHKKYANKYIIAVIFQNLHSAKADDLSPWIERLNGCIVTNGLYRYVDAHYHYGFCHNDFHRNNLLSLADSICILDWGNFSYLIKGWDLAYYLGNFEIPFTTISNLIERNIFYRSSKKDLVGRVFLTFMFIYIWSSRLHGVYSTEKGEKYFIPAIEYIEKTAKIIQQ